jgi:hypothetical protein
MTLRISGMGRWLFAFVGFILASCGPETESKKTGEPSSPPKDSNSSAQTGSEPPIDQLPPPPPELQVAPTGDLTKLPLGEAEIQTALRKTNPGYEGQGVFHKEGPTIIAAELAGCGLKDLSPLRGLKLMGVDLSGNPLRDLRHLRGMPIRTLYLENTEITDLRPLAGMPIAELRLNQCAQLRSLKGLEGMPIENLYLPGTGVSDLTPLKGAPIRQLWLNGSPVVDLLPLKNAPLVSLTLHRTTVSDLSVITDLPLLERLHVGETKVIDLTPLKGMNLTRLVFTPNHIEKGIEEARRLRGLNEIGTQFDDKGRDLMPPASFWARYDEGAYK